MRFDRAYKVKYTATLKTTGPGIKLWVAQPINDSYQKISNFFISLPIQKKYHDSYKNTINYLNFPKNRDINLNINFEIKNKFFTKNINPKITKVPSKNSRIYKSYTKSMPFLEQTEEMKNLAYQLSKTTDKPLDIARRIFFYTIDNFQYHYPVKKRGVKNLQLNNLKGDCGEYSAFFATLCRINNIPTKINTGFVVFFKNKIIKEHAWNSIYLKPYGWLDVDAQYATLEKNKKIALKKYFCKRSDNRINFVVDYNIPIKPNIPRDYKLTYWKEQYLPITRSSAQIIQPLIFATKHKIISFKDQIDWLIKNWD